MTETFVVEQKALLSILSAMQPICSKRTTVDATASILFNVSHKELIMKSTDLEISLQCSYTFSKSFLSEQHMFLVNGKRLFDIVKELEQDITFTLDNNQLFITSESVHVALNTQNAQDFPSFPERIENLMQLDASFVLSLLDKVAFLIPQNNANPALNGLFLEITSEYLSMTTTDGHCLAQIRTNSYTLDKAQSWLLPRRAILELKKVLENSQKTEIFLGVCGNQLVFSGESFNFFTKLLVNPFPEYKGILDKKGFTPAKIDRSAFIKTLRRSACLLSGQFIATSFIFKNNNLDVFMQNKEVGKLQETLALHDYASQPMDLRFYAPYLLNGLSSFSDEQLNFYLYNANKPVIFETHDDKYNLMYLVMPVSPTSAS